MKSSISNKNIILVVGNVSNATLEKLRNFKSASPTPLRFALVLEKNNVPKKLDDKKKFFNYILEINFNSPKSIIQELSPISDKLRAAIALGAEANVSLFETLIPYIPYLRVPTTESLSTATNKATMRRMFRAYDRSITPKFSVVTDVSKDTLDKLEARLNFPVVIKPSGLASSRLVTIAYHREELEKALRKVFRHLKTLHKEYKRVEGSDPQVLVEQFMEGDMYSVDAYVNSRGDVYFCPLVHVRTGKNIGIDDFFNYQRTTPVKLKKSSIEEAEEVSVKCIHAIGLRSSSAHIELMKTEDGWKIIEVGARLGGYRDTMYGLSFGIDHIGNDLRIRMGKKPQIPKKIQGHTAVFEFFAKKEGRIKKILGVKKANALDSLYSIKVNKKIGDRALFAKNGGKSIISVTLFNEDRSRLLADIRRLEKTIIIEV